MNTESTKKNSRWIALLAALVLIAVGVFFAGNSEAVGGGSGEDWLITHDAQLHDKDNNLCDSAVSVCKELCFNGAGQGHFSCFPR